MSSVKSRTAVRALRVAAASLRAQADQVDALARDLERAEAFSAIQAQRGRARMAKLSPSERSELGRKAIQKRWAYRGVVDTSRKAENTSRIPALQRRVSIDTLSEQKAGTQTESSQRSVPQRVLREEESRPRGGGGLRPIGDFLRRSGT